MHFQLYDRYIPTNGSVLFNYLTKMFKNTYKRELNLLRCIVRKECNDAFIECISEKDCELLLHLRNKVFNGCLMELTRYTTNTTTTLTTTFHNNSNITSSSNDSNKYTMLFRDYEELKLHYTNTMKQNKTLAATKCKNLRATYEESLSEYKHLEGE